MPMLFNGRVPAGFARGRSPSIYNSTGEANKTNKFQNILFFFFPNIRIVFVNRNMSKQSINEEYFIIFVHFP